MDTSKSCPHCPFFMGLKRKHGLKVQEGQQFDIRRTIDKFKQEVNMYRSRKPGMDNNVFDVRKEQIPTSGGTSQPSCYALVKLEPLAIGNVDTIPEDGSSCGLQKSGRSNVGHVLGGGIGDHKPIFIKNHKLLDRFISLGVWNEVKSHVLASDEVTGTKRGETCQISLEGAKVSLIDVDYTETRYSKRVHNQEEGIIEDDGELAEANQQSAKEENDKYSMGSNFSIMNLNCDAKASTADLHPHLENECLNGNRVFEKSLTDTLKVVNLNF
ncbi:polynucleotide adenylyltransferase [Sarracenia purpurea var. burkii]